MSLLDDIGGHRVAYRDESTLLLCGDFREVLVGEGLEGLAHVIVADPPRRETAIGWDREVPDWLPWARTLLRRSGSAWYICSLRSLLATDLSGWRLGEEVVWEKHNGSGSSRRSLNRVHELAVQLVPAGGVPYQAEVLVPSDRPRETFTRRVRTPHQGTVREHQGHVGGTRRQRSVVRARSMHRIGIAPTEKPVELLSVLLRASCPLGGLVVDLTAGSASTLLCARSLGMLSVGVEIDAAMCERAAARLTARREGGSHAGG